MHKLEGKEVNNFFLGREDELLKFFDKNMKFGHKAFITQIGESLADRVMQEAREEFILLIPKMPKIRNDDKILERQLIVATQYLAIFSSLKKHGFNVETTWKICSATLSAKFKKVPGILRFIIRKSLFSKKEKRREKESAAMSQKREYPEDLYSLILKEMAILIGELILVNVQSVNSIVLRRQKHSCHIYAYPIKFSVNRLAMVLFGQRLLPKDMTDVISVLKSGVKQELPQRSGN